MLLQSGVCHIALEHSSAMMRLRCYLMYLLGLYYHAISIFNLGEVLLSFLFCMLLNLGIPVVKSVHSRICSTCYTSGTVCDPLALVYCLVALWMWVFYLIAKCNHFAVFEALGVCHVRVEIQLVSILI